MAEMTNDEIAAIAGFTVAFFNSNKELKAVFQKAKSGQWDSARILAAVRKTKWFKTHNEAQRQAQLLKTSDPAEWKRRIAAARTQVSAIARETGLGISTKSATTTKIRHRVAELAVLHGWDAQRIKNALASYNTVTARIKSDKFHTTGLVGQGERIVRQLSRDYGIPIGSANIARLAKGYATGLHNDAYLRDWFLSKAKNTYAGIAAELEQGMTVRQVAEPYIDAMSRLWETNAHDIDTNNPMIRKALTSRDKDGKPTAQPQWQFEEALRKDQRWLSTNNSRESLFSSGYKVLQDMGMVF